MVSFCVSRIVWMVESISPVSNVTGSSPARPSWIAISVPCPLPVLASEPYSSALTCRRPASPFRARMESVNRWAARQGPSVCELEGPIPILKMSLTEIDSCGILPQRYRVSRIDPFPAGPLDNVIRYRRYPHQQCQVNQAIPQSRPEVNIELPPRIAGNSRQPDPMLKRFLQEDLHEVD